MTTSSLGPGNWPVLQLAGLLQSPPLGLIHETVDGKVRSSKTSNLGREERTFRRSARQREEEVWVRQRESQFKYIVATS
jgi:hypothetical protein